jgi:hypothetical protein
MEFLYCIFKYKFEDHLNGINIEIDEIDLKFGYWKVLKFKSINAKSKNKFFVNQGVFTPRGEVEKNL